MDIRKKTIPQKRHSYINAKLNPVHLAILGLLHTVAEEVNHNWKKLVSLSIMFDIVKSSGNLPDILGKDEQTFFSKLSEHSSKGEYTFIVDKKFVVLGVKINYNKFVQTANECQHDNYLESPTCH